MTDITGQRVVIVGGTAGIGRAVARASVAAGAQVIVASSRASSVEATLTELGPTATGRAVDVLDEPAVAAFFADLGPIDHVVYTAGEALSMVTVADLDLEQARKFFQIRYFGALTVVRAAAPSVRAGGSITLTSGSAAQRPGAGWALGASVCGATNALTRALAVELAPIRVNAVAPGVVRTDLWARMSDADRDAMYTQVGQALPVGRVGEVDDIALAYLYCLTQPYGTGTVLTVDGGTVLV